MKLWKLALIAAIAGFIHGVTSSDPPFPSLQRAAIAVTQPQVSSWADSISGFGQTAFTQCTNMVAHYARPREKAHLASGGHRRSDSIGLRVLEEQASKSTDSKSNSEPQMATAGVLLAGNLLSVDVKNRSLTALLEDIGERCQTEILGQDSLPDTRISAKFDGAEVEEGIRQLMRIAGIENYALSHRKDSENQYAVSQIIFFPGQHEPSPSRQLARATPELDTQVLRELPVEVHDELQEEIPVEFQGQLLHDLPREVLTELRKGWD